MAESPELNRIARDFNDDREARLGQMQVAELLMMGLGARQHIRRNALQHLRQEITLTKKKGSFSLEESLAQLMTQGHLSREDAAILAFHPEELDNPLSHKVRTHSA